MTKYFKFLFVLLLLYSCEKTSKQSFEFHNAIISGDTLEEIKGLPSANRYLLKFLDADCSSCEIEYQETVKLINRINKTNYKLLVIGKGRSEKRLQFVFHRLGEYPSYYSYDNTDNYKRNFLNLFNNEKNIALIDYSGNILIDGKPEKIVNFARNDNWN